MKKLFKNGICLLFAAVMFFGIAVTARAEECKHFYEAIITKPSCCKQGYTTHTCKACGNVYIDEYTETTEKHVYIGIHCDVCKKEHPNAKNYKGKVISILGDSISTYKGYIPVADGFNEEHPYAYPSGTVNSWTKTWWGQIIDGFDAKLGINDSWSGSRVQNTYTAENPGGNVGTKVCMPSLTRITNLGSNGTPDVILVYGGTNDGKFSNFGKFDPLKNYSKVDLNAVTWPTFEDAYVSMIMRLQYFYPDAKIIALLPTQVTSWYTDEKLEIMNTNIKEICEYFDITYIDLRESGITTANLLDGLHPNETGMNYIANSVFEILLNDCKFDERENIVYSISHNLNGVTASCGHYKGVSAGKEFAETLSENVEYIKITMGGIDITKDCYKDTKIHIANITGDVVVTAYIKNLEYLLGDVNLDGKVNTIDANYARRYAAGLLTLSEEQKLAADVSGDGEINVMDSSLIRRYVVKYINSFPAENK